MTSDIKPAIILDHTQLSANIGSTARAMLNFGLTDLRLVSPKQSPLEQPARSMAAGADVLLESARHFDTLEEAVSDLSVVYATTARPRDMTKVVTKPKDAMHDLNLLAKSGQKVGVMFGCEKAGLTNDDLAFADKIIEIPVNPDFSSLNLSQAVIVIAYEWYQASQITPKETLKFNDTEIASKEELVNFFLRLEKELDNNGFLAIPGKRDIMVRNIRNIFNRSQLTEQEVRTLHGIVSSLIQYSGPKT